MNKANINLNYAKLPKVTGYDLLVFLIWPFALLIHRLKNIKDPKSKTIFWLFCVFYGFTFIIQEDIEGAADSARYALELKNLYINNISFIELIQSIYNVNTGEIKLDIYQSFITWIVSNFTYNAKVLFTIFSAVFGYFYVQNLWIVFSKLKRTSGFLIGLFITFLILILPIWEVNGVRMWTAAHIYIYGVLLFLLKNKRKTGLFWILASSLVHFSFIIPIGVFLFYKLIKIRLKYLFIAFLISFFVDNINLDLLTNSSVVESSIFESKVDAFTNNDYADAVIKRQEEKSLNYKAFSFLTSSLILFWISIIYIRRKIIKEYLSEDHLEFLRFILLFGIFSQLATLIPSGGRFMTVFNFFLYSLILISISQFIFTRKNFRIIKLVSPFFIYFVFFKIRIGMEFFGPFLIFGNPFISIFYPNKTPLIELIKSIL